VLGQVGKATPDDVHTAALRAVDAQRSWAALPFEERAAVLRRAGDALIANTEEIKGWLARESGAIQPFGDFQVHTSAQECYEASALPSHPYGELLRSGSPRLSFARRIPAGVVGVIAPFNVPTILAIRAVAPALALGNAVILKPDPRTAISGGAMFARIFEEAQVPELAADLVPAVGAPGERAPLGQLGQQPVGGRERGAGALGDLRQRQPRVGRLECIEDGQRARGHRLPRRRAAARHGLLFH